MTDTLDAVLARVARNNKRRGRSTPPRGVVMRGEALVKWRKKLGISQAQAAKWFGVTENSWWRWETGVYPVPSTLQRRITAGDVPPSSEDATGDDDGGEGGAEGVTDTALRERVMQRAVPGYMSKLVLKVGEHYLPVERILDALGLGDE